VSVSDLVLLVDKISYPRLLYLPFLLPKLHSFFSTSLINPDSRPHQGWFSFEGVPLKWHYPVGLLFDLYGGADPVTSKSVVGGHQQYSAEPREHRDPEGSAEHVRSEPLPWRLTVHFSDWPDQDLVRLDADGKVMHDAFINSVKEADFLRNGTAKGIMTLSKEDSSALWQAVQEREYMPLTQQIPFLGSTPWGWIQNRKPGLSCSNNRQQTTFPTFNESPTSFSPALRLHFETSRCASSSLPL
jgi:autophagy-related protein 5